MKYYVVQTLMMILCFFMFSCESPKPNETKAEVSKNTNKPRAKFEPEDGKCILFIGQDLETIGGLENYNDGYFDHFPKPSGFTMYTGISTGVNSFGHVFQGLDGVWETHDWGDGDNNMSLQLADEDFKDIPLAIGFWMVDKEKEIAKGDQDEVLIKFGNWLKGLGNRPVFLRIGYEFAGSWNHYDRDAYIESFRRMKNMYDSIGVNNVAYVWQSHGSDEPMELLESWYPGDEYVDWCSYSFFARWDEANMIEFAREHNKPVFIAEATPTIKTSTTAINGKTKETILSNPIQAEEAWNDWFVPFFKTIHDNQDVVKAVSYINCHWKSHRMWFENPTFQDVDARLQTSKMISKKWNEEIAKDIYLKPSPYLFDYLWGK